MKKRSLVLAAALCAAVSASAQTNRGGIAGTVTDTSGAVIAGADIVVTSQGTNAVFKARTSESGAFAVQNLEPVLYRVEVEKTGFKKSVADGVKVDTASTATLNFQLAAGTVQTEITVSAAAPIVNSESGTAGQTITEKQIDNAPLVNRSVLDLALLIPNVTGDANSEDPSFTSGATVPGYNLTVNGGRAGSTLIMADGVNNTGVGVARAVVSFSPETVQEFTVQTNAFSAEYGRTSGGVINTTTKSGSNGLHGTALWYQRNPATNAAPFTTAPSNRPVSNTRNNQFSLTAGGPVVIPKVYDGRNKTFFFGAFEPRYLTDHLTGYGTMPTDAMRNGDFSNTVKVNSDGNDLVPVPASVAAQFPGVVGTDDTVYNHYTLAGNQFVKLPTPASGQTYVPFPGNIIPRTMLDPVVQKLMQYLPKPNADWFLSPSGNLSNLVIQRSLTSDNTRYTLRLDQVVSDTNRLSFRATVVPVVGSANYGNAVNGNNGNYSSSKQMTLSDTHILTPRMVNDLRLNYTRGRFSTTFAPEFDAKTGRNLSTELGLPSLTHGGVPQMQDGLGTYGWIGSGGSTLGDNVEERYNVADSVFLSRGSMSIKIGVDLTHELLNTLNLYQSAGGIYVFRNYQTNSTGASSAPGGSYFASFLMGVPNMINLNNALLPYYYRWNSGAAFIQDDWKVKSNLTINLGLRYQLQLPRTEKYNHQGTFLPGLAQSYPLAQPLTLQDGEVITSALVPPFGLDGYGGRSRYLWPADYTDFEPRFGFAYSPRLFGLRGNRVVIRGGYGLSHASLNGQNRKPMPGFSSPATAFGETSGQTDPNYVMRLGSNPPNDPALSWNQVLQVPSNGLITLGSINYTGQAFAVSPNMRTPYSQSWNLTVSYQPDNKDVIELAYVGNKGTHLFMPQINQNSSNIGYVDALDAANLSATTTVPDPLGRLGSNGRVITVQQGTLASTYLGFLNLYTRYDSSANSIRHAAYINYQHRASRGLTVTANYTFGKSIDDASDSGPDDNILTTAKSISGGASNFGGARKLDRSVSTFDVKHSIVASFLYDLPVGRGKQLFPGMSKRMNTLAGGWSFSGVERIRSGYPFMPVLYDNNGLGDNSSSSEYSMRPDIVPGVPVVNPLWNSGCPVTNTCEPFVNPAAFERPPLGQIGNAPRTIDGARGPWQQYLDLSIQKSFSIHEGKIRVQFRTDLLNALNHPVFGLPTGYGGSNSWDQNSTPPSTAPITAAQYDTWAKFNDKPVSTTPEGATLLGQVQGLITSNRNPKGALPLDFYSIPVPTGFFTKNANSYDITTLTGYKLYVLRNAFNQGFGDLNVKSIPRYIQFGLKIYF